MKILIANRGEIARRIIRTATRLGHRTVAAYADPDRDAPFVHEADTAHRLGPADLASSYLSVERIIDGLHLTGADAVHPGYGFLAESPDFARAVIEAGATWIGPNPDAIAATGSKIEARRLAQGLGVPIIPGFDESQEPAALAEAAERIGFPVLIKAAAGGGGKGIRIVTSAEHFASALAEASTEAARSFGDGAVIVERYIQRPRHVEVQIVGDRHGGMIHLGTRECSIQRRYQKLFEEAPAPNLPRTTTLGVQEAAVELGRSLGYDSAGTVEFVVDDETGDHYFLEVNARIQVEHPVTEAVTGIDLVELMLAVAEGDPLPMAQSEVELVGHAVEARINAEDPSQEFAPQTGAITNLVVPHGVRWDASVERGGVITPHYDSMIAKLVVHGRDRTGARRHLARALDQLVVGGLVTTAGLHRWLVDQPPLIEGRVTTRFLDEAELPPPPPPALAEAARTWLHERGSARPHHAWSSLTHLRLTPHRPRTTVGLRDSGGVVHEVDVAEVDLSAPGPAPMVDVDLTARRVAVNVAGHTQTFDVVSRSERWAPDLAGGHGHATAITAPFPASVSSIEVAPGDRVVGGDPIVVVEAMKMLHTLTAAGPGVVAEIRVTTGDQVDSHQILVTFEPEEAQE
jgi:acetyl/propionyl-CoA carboxylase alpha subunit